MKLIFAPNGYIAQCPNLNRSKYHEITPSSTKGRESCQLEITCLFSFRILCSLYYTSDSVLPTFCLPCFLICLLSNKLRYRVTAALLSLSLINKAITPRCFNIDTNTTTSPKQRVHRHFKLGFCLLWPPCVVLNECSQMNAFNLVRFILSV